MAEMDRGERVSVGRFSRMDVAVLLAFAASAIVYVYCRWKGIVPFVFLGGDAANISSFAAALDHPSYFVKDPLLSNPEHFRFYLATFIVPLIRVLYRAFGDYGLGFIFLLWPTIFLQLVGFYLLGRCVTGSRFYAFLFSVACAAKFRFLGTGEFWGVYDDAIPRTIFQALLPFLLFAAYKHREKPASWPFLMTAAGLMIYVHPVGAPAVAFSIWLGFLSFLPKEWSFSARLGFMVLCGGVFFIVGMPFLANYLTSHIHSEAISSSVVYSILKRRFAYGLLDIPLASMDFFMMSLKTFLLPATLVGVIVIVVKGDCEERRTVRLIGTWIAGIIFVSLAIPFAEQVYTNTHGMLPLEVDLVRGCRYIFPIAFLFCFWALARLHYDSLRTQKIMPIIGILGVMGFFMLTNRLEAGSFTGISGRIRGKASLSHERGREMIDMLDAIKRTTPPGSSIFSDSFQLPIRYYSLRALAFSGKDGGPLCYSDSEACINWYKVWSRLEEIKEKGNICLVQEESLLYAKKLKADYLLTECGFQQRKYGHELIYSNRYYSLFKLD